MKAFVALDWKCSLGSTTTQNGGLKAWLTNPNVVWKAIQVSRELSFNYSYFVNFSVCTAMHCTKMHKICVRKGRREESLRFRQLRLLFQSSKVHSLKICPIFRCMHCILEKLEMMFTYLRATPLETSQLSIFMALRSASSLPSKTSPKPPFITSPLKYKSKKKMRFRNASEAKNWGYSPKYHHARWKAVMLANALLFGAWPFLLKAAAVSVLRRGCSNATEPLMVSRH